MKLVADALEDRRAACEGISEATKIPPTYSEKQFKQDKNFCTVDSSLLNCLKEEKSLDIATLLK